MIISILFLFFLVLENLLLPALIGPRTFLIIPLFVMALLIYMPNTKLRFLQSVVFLLIAEIFSGARIGNFILPFILAIFLYIWLNKFFEFSSGLRESNNFLLGIIAGGLSLLTLVYIYSYFSLLIQYSADFNRSWNDWLLLIKSSFYENFGWSIFFVILFKNVLKKSF